MSEFKYVFKPDQYSGHSRILRLVRELKMTPLAILDVGTAQGYLGRELSAMGHKLYGIEFDREYALAAQRHYCDPIQVGDLDTMEPRFSDRFFDVIIFGAVLEHFKYPEKILQRLSRCLKTGGRIIVTMPNVANWFIRLQLLLGKWDYQDRGILDRTHLKFYTWKTLNQLLADGGFRVVHSETGPIPLPVLFSWIAPVKPFYFIHVMNNAISSLRPQFFAFEFIVVAELHNE